MTDAWHLDMPDMLGIKDPRSMRNKSGYNTSIWPYAIHTADKANLEERKEHHRRVKGGEDLAGGRGEEVQSRLDSSRAEAKKVEENIKEPEKESSSTCMKPGFDSPRRPR